MTLITTIDDVMDFFKHLHDQGLNFHPDTPFQEYIDLKTGHQLFSDEVIIELNNALFICFEICEEHELDIYSFRHIYATFFTLSR